jgi:hypothetical protein
MEAVMYWQLFLDDTRLPHDIYCDKYDSYKNKVAEDERWFVARNLTEAIKLVNRFGFPIRMSLDHDLGYDKGFNKEVTGMMFVKWLVEKDMSDDFIPVKVIFKVHSANPDGKRNMESYFANYMDHKRGGVV